MLLKKKYANKILPQINMVGRWKLWSKPTIFLCGAFNSHRRDILAKYIRKHRNWPVFYADDIWTSLARSVDNALGMENGLGEFSDVIIIIAESPGTFAEIGAFANIEQLRKKLLVIVDKQYENQESFLNTGPLSWINSDSNFGGALFVDFDSFVMCSDAVLSRIIKGHKNKIGLQPALLTDVELIYLISDIIVTFGPCGFDDVKYVLDELKLLDIDTRLARLVATGLSMKFYQHTHTAKGYVYSYHADDGSAATITYVSDPWKNRLKYLAKALKDNTFKNMILEINDVY